MKTLNRSLTVFIGLVFFAAVFIASAYGATNNNKVITLKVADLFPVTHPVSVHGIRVWMKDVEKSTNGKIKFDYYPAQQLGKAKDFLKLVQDGVADIAFVGPSYLPSNLPLNNVMTLPSAFDSSVEGEWIYWRMCQGILKGEFSKNHVVPIFVYALPSYDVWTADKPVHNPSDLKGLKLRSPGGMMDYAVSLLGGTPISLPITELYVSLQRRVVDGTILSSPSIKPYGVQEILKYATRGAGLGSFVGAYVISERVWKSLPKGVKKKMLQAGKLSSRYLAEYLDKQAAECFSEFEKSGMKIYKLNAKEKAHWARLMAPTERIWIKKLGSKAGSVKFAEQVLLKRKKFLKEYEAKQ